MSQFCAPILVLWICVLLFVICDLCACTSTVTTKVTEVISTRAVTKQCAHVAVRNHQRTDARQTTCGAKALCIAGT